MLELSIAAAAVNGQLVGRNAAFHGVTTDSRQMQTGDLLIAIRGERFDGHAFVDDALQAGAVGAVVDQAALKSLHGSPLIVVQDTRKALGELAAYWRSAWSGVLIGVTGSNGKTTVKEMIAAILRAHAGTDSVLATAGNLNNDIGMPLMLLRLRANHRYAVIEMGMNHLGEIAYLTQLAKPTLALITNAGTAHIGELGSRQAIAQAKAEIFEGLDAQGIAVINADDGFADYWRARLKAQRIVSFGLQTSADISAQIDRLTPTVAMRLNYGHGPVDVTLPVPGRHNAVNALAAAAVAHALQLPSHAVQAGLAGYAGIKGRMQRKSGPRGSAIIDDTYNANPDSVKAAIEVLASTPGRRILVLGDLGELGDMSGQLHTEVGDAARAAGIDRLLTLGNATEQTCQAFGPNAAHFKDVEVLIDTLREEITAESTVLVKGSRFMRMERVVDALSVHAAEPTKGAPLC